MNWKKIFLASIAVITLFGCDTGAPQVETSDGGVTKEEFASSRKESGENGDANEQKKQQLQDGDIPHLIVETIRRLEEEGNENAALYKELTYNYISLSETEKQKFSELSAALESLNSNSYIVFCLQHFQCHLTYKNNSFYLFV